MTIAKETPTMKLGLSDRKLVEVTNRFFSKIEKTQTCWIWLGYKERDGYGRISINDRPVFVHRLSFFIHSGRWPKSKMVIDHICGVRNCVNPLHIREVTQMQNCHENSLSSCYFNKLKTHCSKGHEFTKENTKIKKTRNNRNMRVCKQCARDYQKAKYNRKKELCG